MIFEIFKPRTMILVTSVYVLALVFVEICHGKSHEIKKLPGLATKHLPFKHYAGPMELPTGEKMFYWYTESSSKPNEDPIVLWLTGGPGCSSISAFFTENGPFVIRSDLSVELNPYRWNQKANIVWLESPAGVGFSTPQSANDTFYNDHTTTDRAYAFLKLFFENYPELKDRDFYITGESYGGIYIPAIVNKLVNEPIENVNLKGFAIGNPYTDATIDGNAYMEYYYSHAMISLQNYNQIKKECGKLVGHCMNHPGVRRGCSAACSSALLEATKESDTDALNPYYIYGDTCQVKNYQAKVLHHWRHWIPQKNYNRGPVGPCADAYTVAYLNLHHVQKTINVPHSNITWAFCNDFISGAYHRTDSSLPFYRNILNRGLRVLIYSGDADSVVNFMGTEKWIGTAAGLGLRQTREWKPWFGKDKQLAGYVQEFDGLTFKTVKGAGHMVPSIRPLHALSMFEAFLNNYDDTSDNIYSEQPLTNIAANEKRISPVRLPLVGLGFFVTGMLLLLVIVKLNHERYHYTRLN